MFFYFVQFSVYILLQADKNKKVFLKYIRNCSECILLTSCRVALPSSLPAVQWSLYVLNIDNGDVCMNTV